MLSIRDESHHGTAQTGRADFIFDKFARSAFAAYGAESSVPSVEVDRAYKVA